MAALRTTPESKGPRSKPALSHMYDLSIYSYDDEDLPSKIEPILETFGLRVVRRSISSFYIPHDGTDLYTAEIRLKAPRRDTQVSLAKARSWLELAEAIFGWDVRFEPCKPRTTNAT